MGNNRQSGSKGAKGSKFDSPKVLLSLEYLDIRQGQTILQWSKEADLLLKFTEKCAVLNKLTVSQSITQNHIEKYQVNDTTKFSNKNMPIGSTWDYPRLLPKKNVCWCKIRLGSTRRVIGFMESNIFYIVFLDKDHEFYPTEPNNT